MPGAGQVAGAGLPGPVGLDASRLAHLLPDGLLVVDGDGRVTYLNEVGASFIGATPDACLGRHIAEFVHPDDLMLALSSLDVVAGKQRGTPVELRLAGPDGRWRLLEFIGRDCRDVDGVEGVVCTVRDLTERRMWEVAGAEVTRFQQMVQHAAALVMGLDAEGVVGSVNGALPRLLGHDPSVVVGRPLAALAAPGWERALTLAVRDASARGCASVEVALRHANRADPVPVRLELVDLTADPTVGCVVVTGHDISDLQRARLRLEHQATHDPLTGLPNRVVLDARLGELLAAGDPLAVLFVDLDDFKTVNDTHGHGAGDELLRHAARRLVDGVAAGDLVARLGGDEFVVVSPGIADDVAAGVLATRLAGVLAAPYGLATGTVRLAASVGAVVSGPDATPASLVAGADRAMYGDKTSRREPGQQPT